MIKAFNITMSCAVTHMSFITSMQLIIIENMCLAQCFPHMHNNIKTNNGCNNFRKKQDAVNLCVMNNNDESSNNDDDDASSSLFPSLKTLETEHGIIIDNKIHDDGANDDAND